MFVCGLFPGASFHRGRREASGRLLVSLTTGLPLGPGACFKGLSQHLRLQAEASGHLGLSGGRDPGGPSRGSRLSPGPVREAELPRS